MAEKYKSSKFNYRKKFVPAGFKSKHKQVADVKKRTQLYTENWDNIRKQVYQRDGNRCVMCGKRARLHAHHIVPVKISKDNSLSNLVSVCGKCHRKLESIGFAILERGGGQTEIKRAELKIITEAKKNRALEYMKKLEERDSVKAERKERGAESSNNDNKNVKRIERDS